MNSFVPSKKHGDPERSMKTLPPGLEVRESGVPDAGLGVFANKFFPIRSRFGPFEGRRVNNSDTANSSGYCWQIYTNDGDTFFIDAKNKKTANWMRYVNCARSRAEQNVTAFQYCGEVYYRAHCDIQPGTEMLVWYGDEYGEELGLILNDKKKSKKSTIMPGGDQDEASEQRTFSDSDVRTSDIEFSDSADEKAPVRTVIFCDKKGNSRTRQPSSSDRTQHNSNTSGTPLPLNRSHVCQHCFAAFVLFNSLKLHAAFVHSEKLQAVDKARDGVEGGKTTKGKKDTVGGRTTVETEKNKVDDTDTDRINLGKYDRRHVCDVCNKAFTSPSKLERHRVVHSGEKAFVCDVCSKAFNLAHNLKTHLKIHSGEKAFVCDMCSKAFTQAGDLKKHKRIHTRERPYKCPHCDVACKQSCDLQTHIRAVHAGDRPYVCQVCGAAFSQTCNLKQHKIIHTGRKPHECTVCGKRFAHASNLIQHALVHSGKKTYSCPHCHAEFTLSGNLKRHVQKLHQ